MEQYEDLWFWWYDESIKLFLFAQFWPNFVIGNLDDWMKLGITMNGAKTLCKP